MPPGTDDMPNAAVPENKATSDPPSPTGPTTPSPQPWYRDGKFLVAVVAAVLGTSGIAGTVQVVLENHRKAAELEIAKMNNDAHLKLEQEKQAHGITLAREQQRHSIAEQYLQRVTDPKQSFDNVETVYELIIRIEGADDTRGVSSWAKQQLRRVRERRETDFKAEQLRKQGDDLKANYEEKLAALARAGEGPGTVTPDSKRVQEKYELESAALGLKLLETQKRLADLERQLGGPGGASKRADPGSGAAVSLPVTVEVLVALGATEGDAARYVAELNTAMERYAINTGLRRAHFLAQVMYESGSLRHVEENLNYSLQALRRTWPTIFQTDEAAQAFQKQPARIANRVYANRHGNGAEETGDGWRFRSRGLIALRGKAIYVEFAGWLNDPAVASQPDVVATERYAALSAVFFWTTRNLNELADADNINAITRRISGGGVNGLSDRLARLEAAKQALSTRATLLR